MRSFIDINDVVLATDLIARNARPGDCFHISTNQLISVRDLVGEIAEMYGLAIEDICEIGEERVGKDEAYMLSSEKLRKEFGWTDTVSLQDGLMKVRSWLEGFVPELENAELKYRHSK